VFHQIEQNSSVYVGMLDQRAAFDAVWHSGLLLKLGRLCVIGKMLRTLMESYRNVSCTIKLNSHVSKSYLIQRSMCQGGVLFTFYYLTYVDDLARRGEQ